MKKISILILFSCFSLWTAAQSISGNFNSAASSEALGYGNVDIYQGDKLVASVLTDRMGNFNVALLDTGTYVCVLNYAGFEPLKRTIHVTGDEKADFKAKEDLARMKELEARKKSAERSSRFVEESEKIHDGRGMGSPSPKMASTKYASDVDYSKSKRMPTGKSNVLTAGEINDFSKWKMWKDLSANELKMYETAWDIAPKSRYTVQVQGNTGLPVVDALVHLKIKQGKRLFSARTDNTGKAELWLSINLNAPHVDGNLQIEVEYENRTTVIRKVESFEKGINQLVLNVFCQEVEQVDVAFVFDATGSMGDELNFLQAEMNEIIYQSKQLSSSLNFRFANVFYRDQGSEEYLTREMDFNRILSESVSFIDAQSAAGGGDYEEAVEVGLEVAINKLSWSKKARARILFLILDAPPHNTPEIREKLAELMRQAAEKGIRIVPIGASGINKSTEYLMRSIALSTNGTYTFLTNHSGIGNNHLEPSTDSYQVESLNEILVRILKSYTYMPDCQQNMPELNLPYSDSLVISPHKNDTLIGTDTIPTVRWSYYPNPTNGIVHVVADQEISELFVTDLSGKILQRIENLEKDKAVRIDLEKYASGIYLLRYAVGSNWVTGKIVLRREA